MLNKYNLLKKYYPNYLIIIKKKNKYYTFNYDKLLLNNYKNKNINYIIVDNLDIKINEYKENKYEEYLLKEILINMLSERKDSLYEKNG